MEQTIIIQIVKPSDNATFECQLGSEPFVQCKQLKSLIDSVLMYLLCHGFVYSFVPAVNHTVTVRGTSEEFIVTTAASALGTVITVTIDVNQAATFECKLDDSTFIPCK